MLGGCGHFASFTSCRLFLDLNCNFCGLPSGPFYGHVLEEADAFWAPQVSCFLFFSAGSTTGLGWKADLRLRECCRQAQAEVLTAGSKFTNPGVRLLAEPCVSPSNVPVRPAGSYLKFGGEAVRQTRLRSGGGGTADLGRPGVLLLPRWSQAPRDLRGHVRMKSTKC